MEKPIALLTSTTEIEEREGQGFTQEKGIYLNSFLASFILFTKVSFNFLTSVGTCSHSPTTVVYCSNNFTSIVSALQVQEKLSTQMGSLITEVIAEVN